MSAPRAIVFGAGGAVGEAIALELARLGWRVIGAMRTLRPAPLLDAHGVELAHCDLATPDMARPLLDGADIAVFAPILTISARAAQLAQNAGVRRTVFLSSNNVGADLRAPIYRALAAAETHALAAAPSPVIVRPTLLYGDPRLPTLARLVACARKYPLMPLPGSGRALQQPLFHEDLARVIGGVVAADQRPGVMSVGGPERVTMRSLYARIAEAVGRRTRAAPIPILALAAAARLTHAVGVGFPLTDAQIARADLDRTAPTHPAASTRLNEGLRRLVLAMDQEKPAPQSV